MIQHFCLLSITFERISVASCLHTHNLNYTCACTRALLTTRSVFQSNRAILCVTAYVAAVFWLVFSTLLYVTEHTNITVEAGKAMSERFSSAISSLQ